MSTANTKADPRSTRTRRLEEMRAWRPSESHPVRHVPTRLISVYAQRLFNVTYFFTQRANYGISVLVPIIGTRDQAESVDAVLRSMIEKVEKDLNAAVNEVVGEKKAEGVSQGVDTYTNIIEEVVPCYTPESRRFLSILELYDRYCQVCDELWMSGVWRKTKRDDAIDTWRRKLLGFSTELNRIHTRTLGAARRAKLARIAEAEARIARDEKRAAKGEPLVVPLPDNARDEATLRAEESVHEGFMAAVVEEDTSADIPVADKAENVPTAEVIQLKPVETTPLTKAKRPSRTLSSAAISQ